MGPAQIDRRTAGRALLLLFSLWFLISLSHASRLSPSMQNLEVQKHLRRLNKPPLKTIQVLSLSLSKIFLIFCYSEDLEELLIM